MGVIYAFGDFELDVDRLELRRSKEKVEIQPKVLRLLLHLVTHRARVVSTDELLREVWSNTKVEPGSLKRAILGVRQALNERGAEDSSVRTVRGHGYQFARDVGVVELDASSPRTPAPPPRQPMAAAASGRARSLFVGRERVLGLLTGDLTDALAGRSCCVLLTGEPGIGKSRISEEMWERARELGAEIWLGRCMEGEGVPAFWPFVQSFREAVRLRGPEQVRALMAQGGSDRARALDDLHDVFADLEDASQTDSARFRMFDGVGQFLRRAAEQRPIVLGFDDLHLADAATLQLLTFVVRQAYAAPLFVLGTCRRESGVPSRLLAAIMSADRTRCVELRGLEREDLARYLELATGASPPAQAIDALHDQTAGNPLFVRQLVESSSTRAEPSDWDALLRASSGSDLEGAIERHLRVVSDACLESLRAAAALGREFSESLLVRVCERSIDDVRAHLSTAEATRLIESLPERGRYCFTHGLIRDALYQQLPTAERARLHGAIGRALETRVPELHYVMLAEVTRHFVLAAPTHDERRALHYSLRAADTALGRFAYEEAAEHLETALQLCSYEPPDAVRRMQLLFRLGDARSRSGEREAARRTLFEALYLAKDLGDAEFLAKASLLLVALPDDSTVDLPKVNALREALAALPAEDPRRACVQACLAKSLAYAADRAERVALAHESLKLAAAFDDLQLRSEVMTRCREALVDPEHLQERVVLAAELMQLAHRQGDTGALLRASSAQIETCIERGDFSSALDAAAHMESLAEQHREPFFRWHARLVRSMQAFVFGQPALAEQHAREARAYAEPLGTEAAHHVFAVQVMGIYVMQGRLREAEPLATEMALRYPGLPGWDARLGCIEWNVGRHDRARARLARMMDRGLDWIRREPYALSGMCSVAELCGLTSDSAAARALYHELAPYAPHYGVTALGATTYGPVTLYLGMLAACCGELLQARAYFEQAYESAGHVGSPTFRAVGAYTSALLLSFLGERTRASELLKESAALSRSCELQAMTDMCLTLARQHGYSLGAAAVERQPERS